MSLIFYAIAAFGVAYVVGFSKISFPIRLAMQAGAEDREIVKPIRLALAWVSSLLGCPACIGFWIGVFAALIRVPIYVIPNAFAHSAIALGAFTCGSNFLLARVTGLIPSGEQYE